ncbi:MAG: hypothetical protein SFU91_07825 [Chloroherpetonaceae bacterium]|nr:hypothetical protein [Chloroherpetonaceae bacterium]
MKISFKFFAIFILLAFSFFAPRFAFSQKNSDSPKLTSVTRYTIGVSFIQPIISGDQSSQLPALFGADFTYQPDDALFAFGFHAEITSTSTSERDTNAVSQILCGIHTRYFLNNEAQGIYAFGDLGIGRVSWNSGSFNSIVQTNTWAFMPLGGLGYALRLIGGALPNRASSPHLILTAQFGVGYVIPFSNGESSTGIPMTRFVAFGPSDSPVIFNFKITAGYSF